MSHDLEDLHITLDDLQHHIVKYGVDLFPILNVRSETTRAHALFQNLQQCRPALYQELNFAPQANEFKVFATFPVSAMPGGNVKLLTLGLTQRGPIFAFPYRLPPPIGDLPWEGQDDDARALFTDALQMIRHMFPVQVHRVGLVRELVFATGSTNAAPIITSRFGGIETACAMGGSATIRFEDDRCNMRVILESVEMRVQTKSEAMGRVLSDEKQHGLKVTFDVNNREVRPQEDADIEMTIDRAACLWPEALLSFINWRPSG